MAAFHLIIYGRFWVITEDTEARLAALIKYREAYRRYCWPVSSIADLKLAPFHVLASEGKVHTDKPHTWHMETLARLSAADPEILLATPFRQVDLKTPQAATLLRRGGRS